MSGGFNRTPTANPAGTLLLLIALGAATLFAGGNTPSERAHHVAVITIIGIGLSVLADYRRNLRNLVRADLMAIVSLYFLTLFEFLLPQPDFDALITTSELAPALDGCLVGLAGIAIGRHFVPSVSGGFHRTLQRDFPPKTFLAIYGICLFFGYFYMLLAVDFDVFRMLEYFMAPRFSQPWGRGRLGDWKALLVETGMLIYLVPPIAGIVMATRERYTNGQFGFVCITFLFTLFYGFTSGTRNIFASYLATFLVAFAFSIDPRRKKQLMIVGASVAGLMLVATVVMLEFRNIGFQNYVRGYRETKIEKQEANFFVDYNLYVMAKLMTVFPARQGFLGLEIPYLAAIRPIPRAIWSGKPEGMSVSIEDAVGVEGLTLASSFIGEAYMSGGYTGVVLTGLFFGIITGWWNRFGHPQNSPFGHLVFASGFFAAVISMRSMFVFTTAILPTIGAIVLGHWLLSRLPRRRRVEPVEQQQ